MLIIKGRSVGLTTFIGSARCLELALKKIANSTITCEEAAKNFIVASEKMKRKVKASDFDSLRRYHAVFPEDSKPTKKQPNFARFQNNFERRGR